MIPPILDLDAFADVPFPVATVKELRAGQRLSISAMGRQLLVLWNGGKPRVYLDSCAHLGLPLSLGSLEGSVVRCRYHGWAFATDTGEVAAQPTLRKPRPCRLERWGALVAGGLVFAWMGDPEAEEEIRCKLPPDVAENFVLHRVKFQCPFYLALFNAVDYAHFAEHRFYSSVYAIYRRLRRDAHLPGQPFHWTVVEEADNVVHIRLEEARRDLRLYATCADFEDEGGVNRFQTFVTPQGPHETLYWECYEARSSNPLTRLVANTVFRSVVVHLLDTEDRDWTSIASSNFVRGENIHLSETDLPLGTHLRKFVLPRC